MSKIYDELEKEYAKAHKIVVIKPKTYKIEKQCTKILSNGKRCKNVLLRAKWIKNVQCLDCFYRMNKEFSKSYMTNKRTEEKKKKK